MCSKKVFLIYTCQVKEEPPKPSETAKAEEILFSQTQASKKHLKLKPGFVSMQGAPVLPHQAAWPASYIHVTCVDIKMW